MPLLRGLTHILKEKKLMQILASPFVVLKLLLGALLLAALGASSAMAANLSVNTLSVTNTVADGLCTLSEAITNANEDSDTTSGDCTAGSGADTITFRVSGTITLDSTLPNIADADGLSIDGNDQNVTVSGNNAVQVMRVDAGASLKLLHLTVANGLMTFFPSPGNSDGGGIYNAGTLNVSNSTFSGNFAVSGGGGIYNIGTLTVSHSIFKDNSAFFGGGITNRGGTLTVTDSTFSDNESISSGGGIENLAGTASIIGSTFTRNNNDSSGGGIDNEGTLTVSNSTISGNFAAAGGGGIASTGNLTVVHSTISGNTATFAGGILVDRGIFNLVNSIVANNTGDIGDKDCLSSAGPVNPSGVNLVEDGSCGANSDPLHFITGDPLLGLLADNGGPTQTHALLADSIAIDQADNAICVAAPVNNLDQRGQLRPVDGDGDGTPVCDIGAYEFVPAYSFSGFFPPVDNPPTVNTAKAGSAIPIKFSVGGDFGLNIFATLYPKSQPVACESGAPQDDLEQTATPGSSSLSYDSTTDTYAYVWKTSKAWAGTCRQFIVKLNDATEHVVLFSFK
jgi:hypothetical protein